MQCQYIQTWSQRLSIANQGHLVSMVQNSLLAYIGIYCISLLQPPNLSLSPSFLTSPSILLRCRYISQSSYRPEYFLSTLSCPSLPPYHFLNQYRQFVNQSICTLIHRFYQCNASRLACYTSI